MLPLKNEIKSSAGIDVVAFSYIRAQKKSALLFARNVLQDSAQPSPERRAAGWTRTRERERIARSWGGLGTSDRQHENAAPRVKHIFYRSSRSMWSWFTAVGRV